MLFALAFAVLNILPQNYADKNHDLIDDLDLTELSKSDIEIIDSCLSVFHNSPGDINKIIALGYVCDNLEDASWSKFQVYQYHFIQSKLSQSTGEADKIALTPYLINAMTNLGLMEIEFGNYAEAISYYEKSLEASIEIGDDLGIARSYSGIAYVMHLNGDLTEAIDGYEKGYTIYESLGDAQGMIENTMNIAEVNRNLGNLSESENGFIKCIEIYQKIDNKNGEAICYNNIALIKASTGDISQAIELYGKSLALFNQSGSNKNSATVNNNIGDLYLQLKEYKSALKHYNDALTYFEKTGMKEREGLCLSNIGRAHKEAGEFDLALDYYNQSLAIEESIEHNNGIARCYKNIGLLYYSQNQLDKAINFGTKSVEMFDELGNKEEVASSNISLGLYLQEIGEIEKSKPIVEKGFKIAKQLGFPDLIQNAAKLMTELALNDEDYKTAFEMTNLFMLMKDSVVNLENKTILIRKQIEKEQFEEIFILKEQSLLKDLEAKTQTAKIKEQNYITLLLILTIAVIFLYLLWRRSNYNYKIKSLQEDIFKSQMKPHFLFNVLVSIQSLMVQKRDKDAIHYLSEIASLMRSNLNIISLKKITLKQELELAEQYLKLEKLRFKEKLEIEIINNVQAKDHLFDVPPLITQPIIENAVLHGLKNIDYIGNISIRTVSVKDGITITIEDNGIGIKEQSKKDSKGISMVKSRLKLANSKNSMVISKKPDDSGTKIELTIFKKASINRVTPNIWT